MVVLAIDERDKRADPTGNEVDGIHRVIADHDPGREVQKRGNMWCIDTSAGFPAMNRLTLARIDVDPSQFETFEVTDA